ncbi:hypothetical protein M0813_20512 [Anaeramoeba flamelloides]|uniref:Uncharacterized protein n=1 Tax=Anaeramoeba flamelloides TaxID=1746091 RepID=A0AAV7Y8A6_9EUKA|nr:hypothetical protein M0812_29714 [Anaeramoeba flamelloides]KAJ6245202.1 hypothetical protein M0813_20512 [Anaeramoeba flamelloides]
MQFVQQAKTDITNLIPHLKKIQIQNAKPLVRKAPIQVKATLAIFFVLLLSTILSYFCNTTIFIFSSALFLFWFDEFEGPLKEKIPELQKEKIWIKYATYILFIFPMIVLKSTKNWMGYVGSGAACASLLYNVGWRLYAYFGDKLESLTKAK